LAARRALVHAAGPVTLVGGGPVPPGALAAALALAPVVVAADSGARVPLPAGSRFEAVIGDLDSLADAEALAARGVAVHRLTEQDTTDLEKCLYSIEASGFLAVGFLGGRVDHELAALNAVARHRGAPVVLVGDVDVCFLCPPLLELDLPADTRVSFFPLAPVVGRLSEGLFWSVEGLAMAPDRRIGTSNRALGGPIRVGFDAPGVIAILPEAFLGQVADALGVSSPGSR
jgi:thiamine pyrophosphokinase